MEKRNLPIGFYDSGVGGLSVLKEAVRLMPNENYIYYGDFKNAPYGDKTEDKILEVSLDAAAFLAGRGVKAIVIACNTATSIAVSMMREKYRIPVISIEPAIKPAITKYEAGRVLVLATPATLKQQRYIALKKRLDVQERVVDVCCEGLAGLIEKVGPGAPEIEQYIEEILMPYAGEDVCGLVIGCTHYSFISDAIEKTAKKMLAGKCEIFDGKYGTARHIKAVLEENGLTNTSDENGEIKFFTSDMDDDGAVLKLESFFKK